MDVGKDQIREEKPYELVRTHNCGELRIEDVGKEVTLSGWVQLARDKNHFVFVDLRDRYGITQVVIHLEKSPEYYELARKFGREWVVRVKGKVIKREAINSNNPTGDIEIVPSFVEVLNEAKTPPFTIKDETDGKENLRMQYRYLDIRRNPVREKLILRHKTAQAIRNYLSKSDFVEVETPLLIKSTPEGARDFVVPSRMNPGTFYALPQSPQTFKQLLMVAGMDKYFQIVKCFRDEELRADRQPEFTQVDCEMSFVEQEDVQRTFEGLIRAVFKEIKGVDIGEFEKMSYDYAMKYYGVDKPDLRFDMKLVDATPIVKGKGFPLFEAAEKIVGVCLKGKAAEYSKKKLANLTKLVKGNAVQADGLVFLKVLGGGKFQSGVAKFYSDEDLQKWAEHFGAEEGDIIFLVYGEEAHDKIQIIAGRLRTYLARIHNLTDSSVYKPLWVVDFPLLEWDEDTGRYNACHHPFTAPYKADIPMLDSEPGKVRARAYDMVINGVEVGGGSIRIHDRTTQQLMLKHLGFTPESAEEQFGFLMKAFEYGAPPHGGLAFGMDRLVSLIGEFDSIRECIAFPKNNQGRDTMIDAPSNISEEQLKELNLIVSLPEKDKEDGDESSADIEK